MTSEVVVKKIAHEAPISIFSKVQKNTDYDYCLVHLLEESEEYRRAFFKAKEEGREIYLDTSVFELGAAFNPDKFAKWVETLQPDYYFIPDVLEEEQATIDQATQWIEKYNHLPGKKIGVVQGKSFEEIVRCYRFMDSLSEVDMIAFSFDYSMYRETFPHPNRFVSWTFGRIKLLNDLLERRVINTGKDHHLLGCALPVEFKFYQDSTFNWIKSLDTSNPVVHAIKGIRYQENFGLMDKESQKLFELIHYPKNDINLEILDHNLYYFRRLVNGTSMGNVFQPNR